MTYSWGDDASIPKRSGGFNFDSARKGYDPGRSYTGKGKKPSFTSAGASRRSYGAKSANVPDALNKTIKTDSPNPIIFAVDVTASMEEWPEIIFEKLPLLDSEVARYFPDKEISFGAIGDANSDSHPLQVCDFAKGPALDDLLNSLCIEAGGGGQSKETYELAAYFYLNHCEIPKAKKPILIMTGDEGFYDFVEPHQVSAFIGDNITEQQDSRKIIRDLTEKFDTYLIRKKYWTTEENKISKQWKDILGEDRVVKLEDPRRIVDCAIGIIAACAGQFTDYTQRLTGRQTTGQVSQVMTSLKHVSKKALPSGDAVSFKKLPPGSQRSKKLTDK